MNDNVYDAWEQIVGETLVYNEPFLQTMLNPTFDAETCVSQVDEWLRKDKLIVAKSGLPLRYAFLVHLEDDCDRIKCLKSG